MTRQKHEFSASGQIRKGFSFCQLKCKPLRSGWGVSRSTVFEESEEEVLAMAAEPEIKYGNKPEPLN